MKTNNSACITYRRKCLSRHNTDHFRSPQGPDCLRRKDCSQQAPSPTLPGQQRKRCSQNQSDYSHTSSAWLPPWNNKSWQNHSTYARFPRYAVLELRLHRFRSISVYKAEPTLIASPSEGGLVIDVSLCIDSPLTMIMIFEFFLFVVVVPVILNQGAFLFVPFLYQFL